jgi:hypothetical protein
MSQRPTDTRPANSHDVTGPLAAVAAALRRAPSVAARLPRVLRPASLESSSEPGLQGRISIHDRHQFEIAWNYAYGDHEHTRYRVDVYFYLPTAIGVSAETYDPAAFFGDTQAYIRLATPKVSPKQIIENSPSSPFSGLYADVARSTSQSGDDRTIQRVKLAGCVVRAAIRRQLRKVLQAGDGAADAGPKVLRRTDDFCRNVRGMLDRVRDLRSKAQTERLRSCFDRMEDYLSNTSVEAACDALHVLEATLAGKAQDDDDGCEKSVGLLAGFVQEQIAIREGKGWPTLTSGASSEGLEAIMYRRSLLKKYMFGALFLKVRPLKSSNLAQHLLGALGALLVAVWAFFSNPALFGTVTLNSLTFTVLFVAVFAYILKDRIKELTKQYLAGRFRQWLPDRDRQVFPSELAPGARRPIGRAREYIDFVPPAKVGSEVHALRNAVHTIDIGEDASEAILHYAKVIELWRQADMVTISNGIKDILRFNVRHLLPRLDESLDRIYAYDPGAGKTSLVEGGHVYHVNMVMRCARILAHGELDRPVLERIRLVLNQGGILRVEPVQLDKMQEQTDEEDVSGDSD